MQTVSINEIVETYEGLSDRQKERMIHRATRWMEEQGISRFDSLYRYIAEVADTFQAGYEERVAVRLDHPSETHDVYKGNLHEVIVDKRQNDSFDFSSPSTTVGEAYRIAASFMDERQRKVVTQLMQRSDRGNPLYLRLEEIVADFLGIKWRAHLLAERMDKDARFRQAQRSIVYFRMGDSPHFQWNNRRYHGRPIEFFQQHSDVYGRFVEEGRRALQDFDCGLYAALQKTTMKTKDGEIPQLHVAIPHIRPFGNPGLPEELKQKIVMNHAPFRGSARATARKLGVSATTVIRCWQRQGLESRGIGGRNPPSADEEKKIGELYVVHGSMRAVAREIERSRRSVQRSLRRSGYGV